MKVNILGSEWNIEYKFESEDPGLESCSGYSDYSVRKIVVQKFIRDNTSLEDLDYHTRKILRHEIIHAFLFESGLSDDAFVPYSSWAKNEEMVDWFAFQGPKIYKAWSDAGALQEV